MKTITIPKRFGYPHLDISINGKKYTLKSSMEISVEDEVAEVIEDALALEPKPKKYLSKFAQHVEGSLKEITEEDFDGISMIFNCAFYGNYNLKKVTIPRNITKIESGAFGWCSNLEGVWLPETPPTLLYTNAFDNIKASCVFYCKTQASLDAYKAAPNWSTVTGTYSFVVEE